MRGHRAVLLVVASMVLLPLGTASLSDALLAAALLRDRGLEIEPEVASDVRIALNPVSAPPRTPVGTDGSLTDDPND